MDSHYRKIGVASLIMMGSVFMSKIIGVLREQVIAWSQGAKGAVDAYQIAFVLPEILNHILATGFLSITFIPIFSKYLEDNREEDGWKVFSQIFNCFGILLIILIIFSMVYAEALVAMVAPKLSDTDIIDLAVEMTRIILPAQFFFFAGGLFMAIQFTKGKFFLPAMAPLIYNFGIILGGICLSPLFGMAGFSWGVLGGAFFGNFFLQYIGAKKAGMKYYPVMNFSHPELKRYFWVSFPLAISVTMTFFYEFSFRFFGSYLPEGSIAKLNYSIRIMMVLVGFFGQAVGVATYPFLSKLYVEGKVSEMNILINNTMKYLSVVIPFSFLLMVLRKEIVMILFQRGEFSAADTLFTSEVLVFILIGAVAFAAQTIVTRGYYAMQTTWFPTIVSSVVVFICIPLFFAGIKFMGIYGVATALSITAILQVIILYVLWNIRTENSGSRQVYGFYFKVLLISLIIGGILEILRRFILEPYIPGLLLGNLVICLIITIVFVFLLILASFVFKVKEINEVLARILDKVRRKE